MTRKNSFNKFLKILEAIGSDQYIHIETLVAFVILSEHHFSSLN